MAQKSKLLTQYNSLLFEPPRISKITQHRDGYTGKSGNHSCTDCQLYAKIPKVNFNGNIFERVNILLPTTVHVHTLFAPDSTFPCDVRVNDTQITRSVYQVVFAAIK